MYKEDLALNNLQGLICHKTQPNQGNYLKVMISIPNYINKKGALVGVMVSKLD